MNLLWDTVLALLAGFNLTCMSLCPKVLDFPTSPEQVLKLADILFWPEKSLDRVEYLFDK